jgi:crotonobetaine/carnitine-CoA ligase
MNAKTEMSGMNPIMFEQDMRLRTVPNLLSFAADAYGGRPFLRETGSSEWLTFAGALHSAKALARGLAALGIEPGELIPVMLPNGIDYALTWFALNLRAAAYLSVNTSLMGELLAKQFSLARARVWIVGAAYLPVLALLPAALRASVEVLVVVGDGEPEGWNRVVKFQTLFDEHGPDPVEPVGFLDVCAVGFTSGTTGPSKGVMVPHGQAVSTGLSFASVVGLTDTDVLYSPLPMFHGMATRMGLLPTLSRGSRMVLGHRFSGTRFWDEVIEADATVAQIIFSLPAVLLGQPPSTRDRAHRVTRMFNAHHNPAFRERFGVEFLESFAMSEIGLVTASPLAEQRPGSAGRARPDWEVAIVDADGFPVPDGTAGEIVCRPKLPGLMMRGYLHQPDQTVETTRDLWFHTGDIAQRDTDGYIWFLDRARERIRRRGENISSLEIEDAVRLHPDIADAAAVAHPASAGEDDIRLLVVPRGGCAVAPTALHGWMLDRMPRFMVARYIEVVAALPYTATNKVEKSRLIAAGLGPDCWDSEQDGTR